MTELDAFDLRRGDGVLTYETDVYVHGRIIDAGGGEGHDLVPVLTSLNDSGTIKAEVDQKSADGSSTGSATYSRSMPW